jgi:hypothetical protein
VVAFASDKKMDHTFQSVLEKPRFFMPRPLAKADGMAPYEDDVRAKWWPGEELRPEKSHDHK